MKAFLQFAKTTIVGGMIFLVPAVVATIVIGKALQFSTKLVSPVLIFVPVDTAAHAVIADILAIVLILLACFLAGLLARSTWASEFMRKLEERFLLRIPGYTLIKGVMDSMSGDEARISMRPVLMSLDDSSQLVFEIERLADGRVVVFVPGAPDPRSGSVLVVQAQRVAPLPISVGQALQNLRMAGRGTGKFLG
jgi:uncharacterized membrane protein